MKNTRMQIKPTLNQEECVLPGITFILNIISENGSKNKIKDINSTKTSFFKKKKKDATSARANKRRHV